MSDDDVDLDNEHISNLRFLIDHQIMARRNHAATAVSKIKADPSINLAYHLGAIRDIGEYISALQYALDDEEEIENEAGGTSDDE